MPSLWYNFYYLCPDIPGPTGHLTWNRRVVPNSTMKILNNGHGIQPPPNAPQTANSLNTPTPENSQDESSQPSNPEATTLNSWYLKTTTSLYQKEYDAPTPIVKPSANQTSS